MDAQGLLSSDIAGDLHGLFGIDVLGAHEMPGVIGANGQQGDGWGAEAPADLVEDFAVAIGCVPGAVDHAGRGFEDEAAPEGHAAIAQSARRPVIGGNDGGAEAVGQVEALPPVAGLHVGLRGCGAQDGVVAERGEEPGLMDVGEVLAGGQVEVVVVVVGEQDRVDRGQMFEGDGGRVVAEGSDAGEGADAVRPDGIEEQVGSGDLDEQRGVADVGDLQAVEPARSGRRGRSWKLLGASIGARLLLRDRDPWPSWL